MKNLKVRTALLLAFLPLATMVVVAALYASVQIYVIDRNYRDLIDRGVSALEDLTNARAETRQYALLLYRTIAETDLDRIHFIEIDLDVAANNFDGDVERAAREVPAARPRSGPQPTCSNMPCGTPASFAQPCVPATTSRPWPGCGAWKRSSTRLGR